MTMIPGLQILVDELLRHGCSNLVGNVEIFDKLSGYHVVIDSPGCIDRFKLKIPYGGRSLLCEIIFFGNSVDYPPDILFDDKSFSPILKEISSFTDWQPNNKDALLKLIRQLSESYRRYQTRWLMETFPQFYEQYELLTEVQEFNKDNVEVKIVTEENKGSVNFLVKLPVVFSGMPAVHLEGNPGENAVVLLVCLPAFEKGKSMTQLYVSPLIEKVLRCCQKLRFPAYKSGDFVNYASDVTKIIQEKVDEISSVFTKRKEYFASFLSHFGRYVKEYDSVELTYLDFLFDWDSYAFVLHIKIPKEFPQKCPVLVFQSAGDSANRKSLLTVECKQYPYSPRWTGYEMAEKARFYIQDYVREFQQQDNYHKNS